MRRNNSIYHSWAAKRDSLFRVDHRCAGVMYSFRHGTTSDFRRVLLRCDGTALSIAYFFGALAKTSGYATKHIT